MLLIFVSRRYPWRLPKQTRPRDILSSDGNTTIFTREKNTRVFAIFSTREMDHFWQLDSSLAPLPTRKASYPAYTVMNYHSFNVLRFIWYQGRDGEFGKIVSYMKYQIEIGVIGKLLNLQKWPKYWAINWYNILLNGARSARPFLFSRRALRAAVSC